MKISPLLILVFGLLFFISCSDDDNDIPNGFVTALYNGIEWNATGSSRPNQEVHGGGIGIFGDVANQQGFNREALTFLPYPRAIGMYSISKMDFINSSREEWDMVGRYVTFSDDGDVIEDRFEILEDADNFLEITSVNGIEVKGNFKVTVVRDPNDDVTNPSLPDTIHFTEGQFTVYIEE